MSIDKEMSLLSWTSSDLSGSGDVLEQAQFVKVTGG
jgi:hypothetical protein